MTQLFTYDTHIFQLGLILASLILWKIYPKASAYKWIISGSIMLLAYQLFNDLSSISDNLLHFGLDLLLISCITFFTTIVESKFVRLSLMIISLLLLPKIHKTILKKLDHQDIESKIDFMNDGEILIKLHSDKDLKLIIESLGKELVSSKPAFSLKQTNSSELDDYYILDILDGNNTIKLVERLAKLKQVLWVEYNQKVSLPAHDFLTINSKTTNALKDPFSNEQWMADAYQLDALHKKLNRHQKMFSKPSIIAILDTGVDAQHEDLQANYMSFGLEGDEDAAYHGTHCAGIAAAVSNNGIGIVSLVPRNDMVNITGVRVLNRFGFGFESTIVQGIIDATDMGVDVISLSLGTFTSEDKELAYTEAVQYARQQNVIVIAAAGNSKQNAKDYSPANTPGILAIGSIDKNMKKSVFSNYVEELKMGIYGPGSDIFSTLPKNKYGKHSGTSMSAPFVAGMAGLAKYLNPNLTANQFYSDLKKTAIKKDGILIVNPSSFFEKADNL